MFRVACAALSAYQLVLSRFLGLAGTGWVLSGFGGGCGPAGLPGWPANSAAGGLWVAGASPAYVPLLLLVSVSSRSCRVRQVAAKRFGPTICDQYCSISATRSSASASACRPRGEDELGPPVGAVCPAFQVAEPLQVADQLRSGGRAELGPRGQIGEPDRGAGLAGHADRGPRGRRGAPGATGGGDRRPVLGLLPWTAAPADLHACTQPPRLGRHWQRPGHGVTAQRRRRFPHVRAETSEYLRCISVFHLRLVSTLFTS